uniref:Uncharacterized protein n=1 Tax=Candidatus Kentrum sp. LFY TaxID=2126342 RepID=A0A450U7C2_9GAMM|nr:MAG: hypothetical protein BECKLFY1418A_GA0070994_10027 [Candidatus Kentron sp. LFY]
MPEFSGCATNPRLYPQNAPFIPGFTVVLIRLFPARLRKRVRFCRSQFCFAEAKSCLVGSRRSFARGINRPSRPHHRRHHRIIRIPSPGLTRSGFPRWKREKIFLVGGCGWTAWSFPSRAVPRLVASFRGRYLAKPRLLSTCLPFSWTQGFWLQGIDDRDENRDWTNWLSDGDRNLFISP